MTKRDYQLIANVLRVAGKDKAPSPEAMRNRIINLLAAELKVDNSRFDPVKFVEAANGVP